VAKLLGLGFPGGPIVERVARTGDPRAVSFPRAHMTDQARDFSFSGIKTAVSLHAKRQGPLSPEHVADVAASFQATVCRMLVEQTVAAALDLGVTRVVLTGGWPPTGSCARAAAAAERGLRLHVPPPRLCTDNAAMIAAAGTARLLR
jgi:N6-L-threonylcarbamoyladenine synthase